VAAQPVQPVTQCLAGEWWNGASCVPPAADCAGISGRAEVLLSELRSSAAQIQDVCSRDPSGSECADLKARRAEVLQQYRMLQNEGTPSCRAQLPEPPS
jgi:hypothetical protein